MKNSIFLVILLLQTSFLLGQSKVDQEARDYFWGENDKYKNVIDIPEKWEKESAVIIYRNINHTYKNVSNSVSYVSSIRQRIKLQDQNSVKEYSEFSYKKSFFSNKGRQTSFSKMSKVIIGIKIIKSSGEIKEIDIDKESILEEKRSKVAIPSLEVGDIIDYYIYVQENFKSNKYKFDPIEAVLPDEYPIMNFELNLECKKSYAISFNSYNGAPELKTIDSGRRNVKHYVLEATNIDKQKTTRWNFPLIQYPSYKFQVFFKEPKYSFLPKNNNIIQDKIESDLILDVYKDYINQEGLSSVDLSLLKLIKKYDDREKAIKAYYYSRYLYLTKGYEGYSIENETNLNMYKVYGYPYIYRSKEVFIRNFTKILSKLGIDYEVLIAKKRYDGSLDDLLIQNNINLIIKVKTEKPLYLQYFDLHTCADEISPYLEGNECYVLSQKRKTYNKISRGKLPTTDFSQNVTYNDIHLKLSPDFTSFDLSINTSLKGHNKSNFQNSHLKFWDWVYDDYDRYNAKTYLEVNYRTRRLKRTKPIIDNFIKSEKEKQKEELEKSAIEEFDLSEVDSFNFEIKNTGRYGFDSLLEFSERFIIKDKFIKKAGPNYIIEIGKFMGGQVDIKDKERDRKVDIHMTNPRSYKYSITLDIPEGYILDGLDKLNVNIDNVTGSFISKAEIENGQLIIETEKIYKHNFEPAENWPLMLEFLDAAFQFTNEKILLKKV